jgi:MFS family permease
VSWFIFWVLLDVALRLPAAVTIVSLCAGMVIFALGETMLMPTSSALVNQIAPEHLRGRYNSALGLTWGLSGMVAPAIAAIYFGDHLGGWWPISVGLLALAGSAMMLNLRRALSDAEDGRVEVETIG